MRSTRPLHVVALAAGATLLAACGGAPEASPAPTQSQTPASASPSDAGPPLQPKSMAALTKAGAELFVAHYIDTFNYSLRTGDVEPTKALDDGTCSSCDATLEAVSGIYAAGGQVRGGDWKPEILSSIESGTGWVVDVRISLSSQTITTPGEDASSSPAGEELASFVVLPDQGNWRLDEWTRAQ